MEKGYQVVWLEKALKNLDSEATYIARENPIAANNLVQKIYDSIKLLAQNPALGHPGRIHGTRELVIPNTGYLIPYRVNSKSEVIQILRVFHTSRKPPDKW